jgi:hypothetical protein
MKRKTKVDKERKQEQKKKKLEGINEMNYVINECFLFHVSQHYSFHNDSGSLLKVIHTHIK